MITYFNKNYLDYILLQRTRLTTEYKVTPESNERDISYALSVMGYRDLELISLFLPNIKDVDYNILDIGCGLGVIDVLLSKHYPNAKFYLQDKSEEIDSTKKYNGFNQTYQYYNNVDLLEEFVKNNGVKNFEIVDGQNLYQTDIKFDIIMSLLSCGWHYSLLTYLEYIKDHLTTNGILIIDVRNDTEEGLLYDYFHNVNRIFNPYEKRHDNGIVGYRYICSNLK
jgi:SAM-dependent methyltransferase